MIMNLINDHFCEDDHGRNGHGQALKSKEKTNKISVLNYKILFQWVECIFFVFFIIQKANTSTG